MGSMYVCRIPYLPFEQFTNTSVFDPDAILAGLAHHLEQA